MRRLRLTPEAYADLEHIGHYIVYEQQAPERAPAVFERIHKAFEHITAHPYIGRATPYPDTREFAIPNLPFSIIYRLNEEQIEILTLFHGARNPADKQP